MAPKWPQNGGEGPPKITHLLLKCRPGERDEEREREREPALEEELRSFMNTLRFPNLVGPKAPPRARPRTDGCGGPRAEPPPGGALGRCWGAPGAKAGPGGGAARGAPSQRFFLGLSASRLSLGGTEKVGGGGVGGGCDPQLPALGRPQLEEGGRAWGTQQGAGGGQQWGGGPLWHAMNPYGTLWIL